MSRKCAKVALSRGQPVLFVANCSPFKKALAKTLKIIQVNRKKLSWPLACFLRCDWRFWELRQWAAT